MIEQRLMRLDNEVKALKASMPIAGSLLDTYFYTKISTATYQSGTRGTYKVKFVPNNPADGLGILNMYNYGELLATDSYWSQFNPVMLFIDEGGSKESDGSYAFESGFIASGYGDTYTLRVTVAVYSTVAGHVEIEFS